MRNVVPDELAEGRLESSSVPPSPRYDHPNPLYGGGRKSKKSKKNAIRKSRRKTNRRHHKIEKSLRHKQIVN